MLIALLVLGSLAVFVNLISIIVILLLLVQTIRDMRDTLTLEKVNTSRMSGIEKMLISIHTMLVSEIVQSGSSTPNMPPWTNLGGSNITQRGGKFVTEDGRHEADTFEELIHKISSDPRYRIAKDEDVDKLREQFENHAREFGEEAPDEGGDDDDDDDENDGENWKKKDDLEDGS